MASKGIVELRPFGKLGGANHGWLNTRHHFSFADYYDPKRMNWGALRVWNDDIILPGSGFPPHPHRNMEIISYVLHPNKHPATNKIEGGGGVAHKDNTGSDGVTEPGDVQVMAAGSEGVVHSEFHAPAKSSGKETTNFFQIWIQPSKRVQKSTWGTREFPKDDRHGKFAILASGFEEDQPAALPINTYSRVAGAFINNGETTTYKLGSKRLGYLVVASGSATVNGVKLGPHDGAAIKEVEDLEVTATSEHGAEVLLVDTYPIGF